MRCPCTAGSPPMAERKERAMFGDIIVIGAVGLCVGLALRSLYKDHKAGNHCGGSCASCGKCCRGRAKE